jgi:hypothetical protein
MYIMRDSRKGKPSCMTLGMITIAGLFALVIGVRDLAARGKSQSHKDPAAGVWLAAQVR